VKFQVLFIIFLFAGLLTACSSEHTTGNSRLNPAVAASIQKGITTKDKVRALLGNPQSTKTQLPVIQPPGVAPLPAKRTASEIWAFWNTTDRKPLVALPFTAAKPQGASYTVIIYFDERGVVLDCETEDVHT
jgi:hypothetical protein